MTRDEEEKRQTRRCCSLPIILLVLVAVAIAGGVVVWQFLPEATKDSVKDNLPIPGGNKKNQTTTNNGDGGSSGATETVAPAYPFNQCNDTATCCNGLDALCSVPANEVLYASLHNAQATVADGFYIAGNHDKRLEDALVAGFRGINIDIAKCDGEVKLIHGKCQLGSRDPTEVWTNINSFLTDNPREVILVPMEFVEDEETVSVDEVYSIMSAVDGLTNKLYWHDPDQDWPTLGELLDEGKQILLFHYNGPSCSEITCPPGFHDWFLYAAESEYTFIDVEEISDTALSCVITRGNGGRRDFFAVNAFVTNPLPSKTSSETINRFAYLTNHVNSCEKLNGLDASAVFIDFWTEGNVIEVAQTINAQRGERYAARQRRKLLRA